MEYIKGFLLVVLLVYSMASFSCTPKEEDQKKSEKVFVKTTTVTSRYIALPIQTSGRLYTSAESKLSFKIPGIIQKIYVHEGQSVQKSTRLAALNLIEMNARVKQAQSAFQKAERDLARVRRLYADSVATLEQLQNTQTALDIADSDLKVAQFNLQHSEILAPEKGKLLKRFAEEGELINSGIPVFLFGAEHEGWVIRAGITDRQIVRINIGDKATVEFDAYTGEKFPAAISEIEAIANPLTGTFEVELKLDNPGRKLYSGFIGKVKIIPEKEELYSSIPISAMVEGDQRNGFVYLADRKNSSVQKQKIEIAEIVKGQILVKRGLSTGQEVITDGVSYLSENSLIEIKQ